MSSVFSYKVTRYWTYALLDAFTSNDLFSFFS